MEKMLKIRAWKYMNKLYFSKKVVWANGVPWDFAPVIQYNQSVLRFNDFPWISMGPNIFLIMQKVVWIPAKGYRALNLIEDEFFQSACHRLVGPASFIMPVSSSSLLKGCIFSSLSVVLTHERKSDGRERERGTSCQKTKREDRRGVKQCGGAIAETRTWCRWAEMNEEGKDRRVEGRQKEQLWCRPVPWPVDSAVHVVVERGGEARPGWHSAVMPLLCANPAASQHYPNITPLTAQPAPWKEEECEERWECEKPQMSPNAAFALDFLPFVDRKKEKSYFCAWRLEAIGSH